METVAGRYDEAAFDRPAVGLVVLQSDVVMEHELRRWLPVQAPLLHSRIANDTTVSADTLGAMEARLPDAVGLLPSGIDYGVVAYGCTSATTLIGEARVERLVHDVLPGVAVTNPLTAAKARLAHLGIDRIGLLAPYAPGISQAIVDHLQNSGIRVAHAVTFDQPDDACVARLSRVSVLEALVALGRRDDCDAVFGSCTNLRAFGLLEEAGRIVGKPVFTSNSALAWHIRTLIDHPGENR